jgi:DTW domain-containing protein YfiP
MEEILDCPRCGKPPGLCFCASIEALPTRLHVLILQHPQEPDKLLGTARIANLSLSNSTLKVGLSWPNLTKALQPKGQALKGPPPVNANWGVLFLGPKAEKGSSESPLRVFSKKEELELGETRFEGIVVLDGTWAQAKTLWWRNAWLLKLKRLVLTPQHRSLYGELRREPRREALSTIESIAETLDALGDKAEATAKLRENFKTLLDRYRKTQT